jgi:hypothetical protein
MLEKALNRPFRPQKRGPKSEVASAGQKEFEKVSCTSR